MKIKMVKFSFFFFLYFTVINMALGQTIVGRKEVCLNTPNVYSYTLTDINVGSQGCDTCSLKWCIYDYNSNIRTQLNSGDTTKKGNHTIKVNWDSIHGNAIRLLPNSKDAFMSEFEIVIVSTNCGNNICSPIYPSVALFIVKVFKYPPLNSIDLTGDNINSNNELLVPCGYRDAITLSAYPNNETKHAYLIEKYNWIFPSSWTVIGDRNKSTITLVPDLIMGDDATLCVYGVRNATCGDNSNIRIVSRCIRIRRKGLQGPPITPNERTLLCANQIKTFNTKPSPAQATFTWKLTGGDITFLDNSKLITGNSRIQVKAPANKSGSSTLQVKITTPCGSSDYSLPVTIDYGVPVISNIVVSLCESPSLARATVSLGHPINEFSWNVTGKIIGNDKINPIEFDVDFKKLSKDYMINVGVNASNACGVTTTTKWIGTPCSCCGDGGTAVRW
jgi:hypothetical protein